MHQDTPREFDVAAGTVEVTEPRRLPRELPRGALPGGRGRLGRRRGAAGRPRALQPEDASLARTHGEVLLCAGRWEEARAALEAALRLDPHDSESRRLLGRLTAPR